MRLAGDITAAAASLIVDTVMGLPTVPFTLMLDPGANTEEIITVTAAGGTTLTVTRGVDGTSAQAHLNGGEVRHAYSARDFQDSRNHEANTTTAHGVTGAVVGTTNVQALTNKTVDGATNTFSNIPSAAMASEAWTAYTPVWTNLTLGNGTFVARYLQTGKTFNATIKLTFGSTTTVAGIFYPSMPATLAAPGVTSGVAWAFDTSASAFATGTFVTNVEVLLSATGPVARANATTPWTWAVGDFLVINIAGEVA